MRRSLFSRFGVRSGLASLASLVVVVGMLVAVAQPATAAEVRTVAGNSTSSSLTADAGTDVSTAISKTADLSKFNAGNIISDAVFFNSGTMTEAQIQSFLEAKVPSCRSGYTCLKDWWDTSRSTSASAMCDAYNGGVRERASTIIYKVAKACGINPQVLLVMLEKEQGLVSHVWPSEFRYTIAMGQGCPDTAACDTQYYGFFNQVYGAARQLKIYTVYPNSFTYRAGQTNSIYWHPNASCGRSSVYIENQATANLYIYTPYRPNTAALNAGYGTGDGCSSYGNRNFYQYFTDWFGSTQSGNAQLLTSAEKGDTYLVTGGKRYRIPNAERAGQFTWMATSRSASESEISGYTDAGVAPRVLRTEDGIYLLDSGQKFKVPSCVVATDYGWDCDSLPSVPVAQIAGYRDGGNLERVVQAYGTQWLIQAGGRREILDLQILSAYGVSPYKTYVSNAMASEYTVGDAVLNPGIYKSSGDRIFAYTNGGIYDIPANARVDGILRQARTLRSESSERLQSSGELPLRISIAGSKYILAVDGFLRVDAYASTLTFTALASGSDVGLPLVGSALGPHFVRESSDPQVYLISAGTSQAVSTQDQAWVTAHYGVSSRVYVLADTSLEIPPAPISELIVGGPDGTAYLIDRGRRYSFRSCDQVSAWGASCSTLKTVTPAELSRSSFQGSLESLVRKSDGSVWLVQEGKRREVPDANVLAPYGIGSASTQLTSLTIGLLEVGAPVVAPGAYFSASGDYILATSGGVYSLSSETQLSAVTGAAKKLSAESIALMPPIADLPTKMVSDGKAFILTDLGWLRVDPVQYGGVAQFESLAPKSWDGIRVYSYESRPHFVRERGSSEVYLVSGGVLQPTLNASERQWIVGYFGVPSYEWSVPVGTLAGLPLPIGAIVRTAQGSPVLIDAGVFYRFGGCAEVADFGRDCASLASASSVLDSSMRDGGGTARLLQTEGGSKWLVQSATKREVPDVSVLAPYGIDGRSIAVSAALLSTIPTGTPVLGQGIYTDGKDTMRLVTSAGAVRDVPAGAHFGIISASAKTLSSESISKLSSSAALPVRVQSAGSAWILSSAGWLQVGALDYGHLAFTTIDQSVFAVIPALNDRPGAHFVRENSSLQVYLASGGLTAMVDEQNMAWITANYGVPPTVWVVADGALQ